MPNPVPETCTWLTLSAALPVLLAVTGCKLITPTELLTVTLVGFTESCGVPWGAGEGGVAGALLTEPAHPKLVSDAASTATRNTNSAPRLLHEECMIVDFPLEPESWVMRVSLFRDRSNRADQPGGGLQPGRAKC